MPRTMTSTASGSAFRNFFAALLQEAQHPARQAEAGGKGQAGGAEQAAADQHRARKKHDRAEDAGHDPEFLRRPVEAGLRQAAAERYASFPSGAAPRDPSARFRPARGASAGSCRLRGRGRLGLATSRRGGSRPFSRPTATDRGKPRRCRRQRWRRGRRVPASCMFMAALLLTSSATSAASSAAASRFSSP